MKDNKESLVHSLALVGTNQVFVERINLMSVSKGYKG